MKKIGKFSTAAAAAALMAMSAASPAQARHDRDRNGIDSGDIIAGVAILGGIAAVAAAIGDDDDRYRGYGRYDRGNGGYGYGNDRYGYGGERAAVNACAREAQRVGGNVRITDIDRDDGYYRVRGRVEVVEYDYGRWNRRPDIDRERFTCYARNGRVYDFRV